MTLGLCCFSCLWISVFNWAAGVDAGPRVRKCLLVLLVYMQTHWLYAGPWRVYEGIVFPSSGLVEGIRLFAQTEIHPGNDKEPALAATGFRCITLGPVPSHRLLGET